jgi:hypothetical protein
MNDLQKRTAAAVTAGHDLTNTVYELLTPDGLAEFERHAAEGAAVGLTFKWHAGRCEVRLGLLLEGAATLPLLAVDLDAGTGAPPKSVLQ